MDTSDVAVRQPPPLLDQLRGKIRLKHYSIRTEDAYVDWVRRFILFHAKRHPLDMGAKEVETFLTHLAVQGNRCGVHPESSQERIAVSVP